MSKPSKLIIFSGSANPSLTESICKYLNIKPGLIERRIFNNGELGPIIGERNLSGKSVFIVQSCGKDSFVTPPETGEKRLFTVNDSIIELRLIADALRRADVEKITAVLPYFPYQRQERKDKPGVSIAAKLAMDGMVNAGISRFITMDLHADAIQGFTNATVNNLFARAVLIPFIKKYLSKSQLANLAVVSTDVGGAARAREYAKRLGVELILIDKRKEGPGETKVEYMIGYPEGKTCLMVDDMVDTASSLGGGANVLIMNGAKEVLSIAAHLVLSTDRKKKKTALQNLMESPIKMLFGADTLPITAEELACPKIKIIPTASLLGEAIKLTHQRKSLSALFK